MDCCNYMPYRQPYYGGPSGSPYYEHLSYPGDFYGQPYHEYGYGTPPYYAQHWPCAATIPDYVYNPKEARIRKAMREASRERALGTTSMSTPRNVGRRQTNWMSSHEEQLMMTPPQILRGPMNSPMCGSNPGFAEETVPQFMSLNGFSKDSHVLSSPGPIHSSNSYLQTMQDPLVQLQHETSMWHGYSDPVTSRPSDNYLLPDLHPYQQSRCLTRPNSSVNATLEQDSEKFLNASTVSRGDENIPPRGEMYESKMTDEVQNLMANGNAPPAESFLPIYSNNIMVPNHVGKNESAKTKKSTVQHTKHNTNMKSTSKPLPDFNEAFGTTERGRFQSPPDPRLVQQNKGYMDYFFNSNLIKYEDYTV